MRRKEIRIAGFGGQGIVLSGSIVGKAASIYDGKFAVLTQSYGPESRGGACRAEVVISESPIDYPYVIDPQVQVILSQEAYREYGQVGQPDTLVMVDSDLVNFDRFVNPMPLRIPASRMAQELGRPVVANIIVLGFLAAKSDIVSYKALRKAILDSIPRGTEDLNMKAFEMGYKYDSEHTNG
ncbi:MAG: pyruvate ferredoxin oxidoreductase, partial [Chloroflexi bacterium]|nr:pyruvate ferredoxin oxidoreductase [Chloroflexota bacterium]